MIKIGDILDGRFRIISEPREGGMSYIYKAYDIKEKKLVAVKYPKENMAGVAALKKMQHEEKIISSLEHKNIVKIYPVQNKSASYQVMELLDGITLEEFIKKHRWLVVPSAVKIIFQLVDALEYIHSAGIIHQDLKPANIIVGKGLDVKIMDFGLSYSSQGEVLVWKDALAIGGTPAYTTPQRLNGDISAESDVFSLGVIFYQMLTGRLPYTENQILSYSKGANVEPPPAPSQYNPTIHPKLDAFILKAISLDKNSRFPTASAFGWALTKILREVLKYKKRKINWLGIFLVVVLAVLVFLSIKIFLLLK